jgi:hypothetical protein
VNIRESNSEHLMAKKTVVSKAEAGRRWSVGRSMVSGYVRRNMPVRADGRLDWEAVDAWRKENIVAQKAFDHRQRECGNNGQRGPATATDPKRATTSEDESIAEAARQLEWQRVREKTLKVDREEGLLVSLVAVNAFVAGMIVYARETSLPCSRTR